MKPKTLLFGRIVRRQTRIEQLFPPKFNSSASQYRNVLSSFWTASVNNTSKSIPRCHLSRSYKAYFDNRLYSSLSSGEKYPGSIKNDKDEDDDNSNVNFEYYDDSYDEGHNNIHVDDLEATNNKWNNSKDDSISTQKRIWLDPNTTIQDRVNRFVNQRLGTLHPLDITLASVDLIRECGKMKSFEGMKYAHDILDRLLEEKRHVNSASYSNNSKQHQLVWISERPFKVLMYGWANLCQTTPLAPQRMREIIELMIQEAEYDKVIKLELSKQGQESTSLENQKEEEFQTILENVSCQPTIEIYNTMLQGLVNASSRSIAAAGEAEKLLNTMRGRNRKRGWHTKPNSKSFTLAITAFCQTNHRTAGDRAEAILRQMIQYHKVEKDLYYQETGEEYNVNDVKENKRKIVTPDTVSYSAVIQAHAQSDKESSAEKALNLLSELLSQSNDNPALSPDAFVFANTINAYAKMAGRKKTRKGRLEAAEKAEYILWLMVEVLKQTTEKHEEKSTEIGTKNPFQLNLIPFNACLHAWAQSNVPESALRAEKLLQEMLKPKFQEMSGGIQPNTSSFNTCMTVWAKASRRVSNAPEKAEQLLNMMATGIDEKGNDTKDKTNRAIRAKPDVRSYCIVMSAYAKSNRKDKASQARRILNTLLSLRPENLTAVPFTTVLNAVAHSSTDVEGDQQADLQDWEEDDESTINTDPYTIALETYLELQEDTYNIGVKADHIAYTTMLDVLGKHTEKDSIERRQRIESVFDDARMSGQVSSLVLHSLLKVCPSQDMIEALLEYTEPNSIQNINVLPREWTRNVGPKYRKLENKNKRYQGKKKKRNRPPDKN